MALGKRRWAKSPAVLLVAFAMLVVSAGLVYAHWTSTSRIEANVNTGGMDIGWNWWGTNDDGDPENDPSGNDDPSILGEWSSENGTSLDPSSWDNPAARYDKNVAGCYMDGGGDTLNINVDGAYPSYHCHIYADAYNNGSVPAKATALRLTAVKGADECSLHINPDFSDEDLNPYMRGDDDGEYIDLNLNDMFDGDDFRLAYGEDGPWDTTNDRPLYDNCTFNGSEVTPVPTGHPGEFTFSDDLTLHIEEGILCGTQVDPQGDGVRVEGWMHVEQGMEQGVTYRITLEQDWVNWNEFPMDYSMCTFNGDPLS